MKSLVSRGEEPLPMIVSKAKRYAFWAVRVISDASREARRQGY